MNFQPFKSFRRSLRLSLKWHNISCLLAILIFNSLIVETWQQIQLERPDSSNPKEEVRFNYNQGDKHHIVKRKSKGKGLSRSFGFGKKPKAKPAPSAPYPKQPGYNPSYPGSSSHSTFPKQPAYNPNYPAPKQPAYNPHYPSASAPAGPPPAYPGRSNTGYQHAGASNPAGPPPPYPGLGVNRGGHAAYPQQPGYGSYPGYSNQPGSLGGSHNTFGGNTFGNQRSNQPFGSYGSGSGFGTGGYRKNKGLGIGKSIGSAGFGALAGTALGAYGGYKLGRMVGRLGRSGHYGYYSDHGRYIRCNPPSNIKIDPETNVSYIPANEAYDPRCSYFDREPPSYIEPSMLRSSAMLSLPSLNFPMIITLIFASQLLTWYWNGGRSRTITNLLLLF